MALIEKKAAKYNQKIEIDFWQNAIDVERKVKQAVTDNTSIIVAAGGDGTANVIAKNLLNTNTSLGIIPVGSGNGLARHLRISLNAGKAIENIFSGKTISIDTGMLNEHFFVSNCGVGFLADVIHSHHGSSFRGLLAYAQHITTNFISSKTVTVSVEVAGKKISEPFFFISACNANQFGYNFRLAPDASLEDGLLEFFLVSKISPLQKIGLLIKVMRGKSYGFSKSKLFKAETAELVFEGEMKAQIDGDPILIQSPSKILILKSSLKVIVPN